METVEDLSGYCAGCGGRLEKETEKTVGVFVPHVLSTQKAIYLLCMPCFASVQRGGEEGERRMKRIEQRVKLYESTGGNA